MKKEKTVNVEMTEAEMEQFVAQKAKEAVSPPPKEIEVTLLYEHSINGQKYFKGKQKIREDHANLFLAQEASLVRQMVKNHESNDNLIQIIGAGLTRTMTQKAQ